jgi:hypothetical protein
MDEEQEEDGHWFPGKYVGVLRHRSSRSQVVGGMEKRAYDSSLRSWFKSDLFHDSAEKHDNDSLKEQHDTHRNTPFVTLHKTG